MDSRESGNNDIRLADEIHGVAKLKWYDVLLQAGLVRESRTSIRGESI